MQMISKNKLSKIFKQAVKNPKVVTKTLSFEIKCGETTCFSAPGKPCKFFGTKRFGTVPVCMLLNSELQEKDGWVQRLPQCRK